MTVAENVAALRKDRGLTQEQLGVKARISGTTVQNIERGDGARTETLRRLAEALGVSVGDLFEPNGKRKAKR